MPLPPWPSLLALQLRLPLPNLHVQCMFLPVLVSVPKVFLHLELCFILTSS